MKRSTEEDQVWIEIFIQRGTDDEAEENERPGGALAGDPTTRDGGSLQDAASTPRDGGALPNDAATPPQPSEPGGALPDSTEAATTPAEAGFTARRVPGQRTVDYTITHPNQTRFTCPDCRFVYTTHNSLVRHVGVSHGRLKLNISFKCALCDYTHGSLKSTSTHYRITHGAAVPPIDIPGSNEKKCPFCPRTFPSTRSCSTHVREQHMELASAQRAREAADKEAQRGTTTAGTKWGEGEIGRFKEALARLGPNDNTKLAEAVGTRDKAQVSAFKCRFLKKYPTWLKDHCPPGQPTAPNSNGSPTPSPTSSQATTDHRPPTTRTGTRAKPAGTRDTRARNGRATSSPTSPTPTPLGNLPLTTSATERQCRSPEGEVSEQLPQTQVPSTTTTQEERTPSPPPVPISEETTLRLQRLEHALHLLRPNPVIRWEPTPPGLDGEVHALPGLNTMAPVREGGTSRTQHMEEALGILSQENIELWDPAEELLSPTLLAGLATPPSAPPPPAATTQQQHGSPEGSMGNQIYPAATTQPAPTYTPPLARATEGQHGDPGEEEVDRLLQELAASPEEALVPPPTTLRSCIDAQPFVPGTPWASERVQRLDQVLRTLRGEAPIDTSSCPTPPSSPQHTPPPAMVSERQHCSPVVGVEATQTLGVDGDTEQPLLSPLVEAGHANPTHHHQAHLRHLPRCLEHRPEYVSC